MNCFCRLHDLDPEHATYVRNGTPLCNKHCAAAYDEIEARNGNLKGVEHAETLQERADALRVLPQ